MLTFQKNWMQNSSQQFMAGVPEETLEHNANQFTNTSIDYSGPFPVKL